MKQWQDERQEETFLTFGSTVIRKDRIVSVQFGLKNIEGKEYAAVYLTRMHGEDPGIVYLFGNDLGAAKHYFEASIL